jgi:hypothetical protein
VLREERGARVLVRLALAAPRLELPRDDAEERVLPAPFAPTIATFSPRSISNDACENTSVPA